MKQAETLTSLEQVLKQIKYSLDSYYSFCVKKGFVLKVIPVRENIEEVSYLLNMIESQKDTEISTSLSIILCKHSSKADIVNQIGFQVCPYIGQNLCGFVVLA
ncbi:Uncharacterised protein [Streptococcus agalactiae]|nr:Uncharacterised protein [Streptococcus agalactiae]